MPSLTISLFSWTNRRFAFGSVCYKCLLFSSRVSFRFIALNTKAASCSTHACIFFIASKVYDATFIGIGVVSVKTSFMFVVSSPRALCLVCCFCSRISISVSKDSPGRKKSCSSSATSVDYKSNCIGRIVISFLIFSSTVSLGLRSMLDGKSRAVWITFVWKKRVTDLLSVITSVGRVVSHRI